MVVAGKHAEFLALPFVGLKRRDRDFVCTGHDAIRIRPHPVPNKLSHCEMLSPSGLTLARAALSLRFGFTDTALVGVPCEFEVLS